MSKLAMKTNYVEDDIIFEDDAGCRDKHDNESDNVSNNRSDDENDNESGDEKDDQRDDQSDKECKDPTEMVVMSSIMQGFVQETMMRV